jgi:hypothetical protein
MTKVQIICRSKIEKQKFYYNFFFSIIIRLLPTIAHTGPISITQTSPLVAY